MAHYLHLTDGVADLDLAVATGIGIALVDISLPHPQRVIQRTSGFPFVDGQRTVASSLADATLDYVGTIYGASVDDVESRLQALTRLLEQARMWEEQRVGTPVRIAFKRQGTMYTAYWLVTGAPTMPHPDQGPDNWLDVETAANSLTFSMSLTLEPVAHSDTLATLTSISVIDTPTGTPSIAVQSLAGNVTVGSHVYAVSYVTARGETPVGPSSATATTSAGNQQVALTSIPLGPDTGAYSSPGVIARNIYRSAAGTTTPLKLLTTLANNTATTYTDNTADASLGAQPPVNNTTGLTQAPGANTLTGVATGGDMPGPVALGVTLGPSAVGWTEVWVAICPTTLGVFNGTFQNDYSGTTDAAAFGGAAQTGTATGTVSTVLGNTYTLPNDLQTPIRAVARIKVTSGTPTKLQAAWQLKAGDNPATLPQGAWATMPNTTGQYYLLDLGTVPALTGMQTRLTDFSRFAVNVLLQTSDGSSVAYSLDYVELVPFVGFVKMTGGSFANGYGAAYEDVASDPAVTFYWPRMDTQTYSFDATPLLMRNLQRAGRIARLAPNTVYAAWVAGQFAGRHTLADVAGLYVQHLRCYSVGLRGSG